MITFYSYRSCRPKAYKDLEDGYYPVAFLKGEEARVFMQDLIAKFFPERSLDNHIGVSTPDGDFFYSDNLCYRVEGFNPGRM